MCSINHILNVIILEHNKSCCVFPPANKCSARPSLVEINFLMLKQLFPSLTKEKKEKRKSLRVTPKCW